MRWPFAQWGANLVLSGHPGVYERLQLGSPEMTYVVNGAPHVAAHDTRRCPRLTHHARPNRLGRPPETPELATMQRGGGQQSACALVPCPVRPRAHPLRARVRTCVQVRYSHSHGALLAYVDEHSLRACFYSVAQGGTLVDAFTVSPPRSPQHVPAPRDAPVAVA